jgi:hypothetical protein
MVLGVLACARAQAQEPEPEVKPIEQNARWVVSDNGTKLGVETLKAVVSETRTRFASGAFNPAAEGAVTVIYHLQRNPDGKVQKYRRVRDERKGAGVFAFQRGDAMRIVGVNSKKRPIDLDGSARFLVWDSQLWAPLWDWLPALERATQKTELAYLDLERGTTARATAEKQPKRTVLDPNAAPVEVVGWQLTGLGPGKPLTLWLGPSGELVGAERGSRQMLLADWAWQIDTPPTDAAVPPGDPPKPAGTEEEGGPDVGP